MTTFLLTWNPKKWDDDGWVQRSADQYRRREKIDGTRWSSARRHGYELGDRVFLLKQGVEPRGIVGSGWVDTDEGVFLDDHFNPARAGEQTWYIPVDWEVIVPSDDPLPLEVLKAATSAGMNWRPQGSGQLVSDHDALVIESLWARHTGLRVPDPSSFGRPPRSAKAQRPSRSGWQQDPVRRRLVEDHAQSLLEQEYRDRGWEVEDTRWGNPFDAVARKPGVQLYLEAKGTESDGRSIEVTAGAVRFAREHPGQCVMGIVSKIRLSRDGVLDPSSGTLVEYDWAPDTGQLAPTRFRWTPPGE